jgi:hypothetical protein
MMVFFFIGYPERALSHKGNIRQYSLSCRPPIVSVVVKKLFTSLDIAQSVDYQFGAKACIFPIVGYIGRRGVVEEHAVSHGDKPLMFVAAGTSRWNC